MKEVESLLKRAEKYFESADLLLRSGDYESCVSRVYYAMFFSAEAVLLKKGLSFSSHKAVIGAFGEHFIRTGLLPKELGKELNRAFEKRQLSDYEYHFVITEDEAMKMIPVGKNFVGEVVKLITGNL